MIIDIPISLGELIDKISILIIKEKNIKDDKKINLIREELELLNETLKKAINNDDIRKYLNKLIEINSALWEIEDTIRECEKDNNFDQKLMLKKRFGRNQ